MSRGVGVGGGGGGNSISYKIACVPIEDADQPAYPQSDQF